jgi:hypothetical protein
LNFSSLEFAGHGVKSDAFNLSHERYRGRVDVDVRTECALLDAKTDHLGQVLPPELIEGSYYALDDGVAQGAETPAMKFLIPI